MNTLAKSLADLERLVEAAGDARGRVEAEASTYARTRFEARLRRLADAKVPLRDDWALALALVSEWGDVSDHPPLDGHERRIESAIDALRTKHAARVVIETPGMVALRAVLRARARRRLDVPYVMLLGSVGAGKTLAASHGIASIDGGAYMRASTLRDLASSYHRDDRAELRRFHDAPVAVVDEVGIDPKDARANDRLGRALDEVIDARQGARRITVVCGNVKPAEVAKLLDARSVSRMRDRTKWVQCADSDLRRLEP
jgi:hypothetical protein